MEMSTKNCSAQANKSTLPQWRFRSLGVDNTVANDGRQLVPDAVQLLQLLHQLGQFIGLGVCDMRLEVIDLLQQDCILPVLEAVGHKGQELVLFFKYHCKLCMYLAELWQVISSEVASKLTHVIIIK